MNRFLYFIPGDKQAIEKADLDGLGLGHLNFRGVTISSRRTRLHGANGTVFYVRVAGEPETKCGVYPDEQTWICCEGGAFHIGWYKDRQPGPSDLALKPFVKGERVLLGDDHEWEFPDIANLPRSFGYNEHGEAAYIPMAKYDAYREARQALWNGLCDTNGIQYTDAIPYAVSCLSVNYRLSKAEVFALRLFDGENMGAVVDAAISWGRIGAEYDALRAGEKKTDSESGETTETGERDG